MATDFELTRPKANFSPLLLYRLDCSPIFRNSNKQNQLMDIEMALENCCMYKPDSVEQDPPRPLTGRGTEESITDQLDFSRD